MRRQEWAGNNNSPERKPKVVNLRHLESRTPSNN